MPIPAILSAPTAAAEPQSRSAVRRLAYLTIAPLWERVRRGEGALVALNATIVVFAQPVAWIAGAQIGLSALLMAALYGINDWRDAEDDRRNPKKNQRLVEELVDLRRPYFAWLWGLQIGVVALAFALLGAEAAAYAAAMVAVNLAYSWWLKGVPIADLVTVCAWGAIFTAVVTPPWSLCVIVGLMTGIMHVFQIQEDRDVDAANHVKTTVVGSRGAAVGAVAVLCGGLYLALLGPLGPIWATTAFAPLGLQRVFTDTGSAWMASRIYCGIAVLAVLGSMYEIG